MKMMKFVAATAFASVAFLGMTLEPAVARSGGGYSPGAKPLDIPATPLLPEPLLPPDLADPIQSVPEPTTVLGTLVVAGIAATTLKRKMPFSEK